MITNKEELFNRICKNFEERGFAPDEELYNENLKKVKNKEDIKGKIVSNSIGYYGILFKDEEKNIIDILCSSPNFEQIDVYFDWSETKFYFTISLYTNEDVDGVKDNLILEYISKENDTFKDMLRIYKEKLSYLQNKYPTFDIIIKNLISLYTI